MTCLLDTNIISELMIGETDFTAQLAKALARGGVTTSTIVRGEILFGIERMAPGKRRTSLQRGADDVFKIVGCVDVPVAAADIYAKTKQAARLAGTPLNENDLWIAATALALGAILVTRDRDFASVPRAGD